MINLEHVFKGDYYKEQVSKYQHLDEKTIGSAQLSYASIDTVLDGYLYKSWVKQDSVPILKIDNEVWMSLTPMEVESHYVPIDKAVGRVGVGGLGFGYYIQEILKKDNITSIDVYEINQDVIDMYISNFGHNPKVNIIKEDVLSMVDKTYDFFYCDIYPDMLNIEAIKHMYKLKANNRISDYFFWTQEGIVLSLIQSGDIEYVDDVSNMVVSSLLLSLINTKGGLVMNFAFLSNQIINTIEEVSHEY